jgi:hypothetical protein
LRSSVSIECDSEFKPKAIATIHGEGNVVLKVAKGPHGMHVDSFAEPEEVPRFPYVFWDAFQEYERPVSDEYAQVLEIPEPIDVSGSLSDQGSISLPKSLSECFSKPGAAPMRNESVSAAYGSLFPEQSLNASSDQGSISLPKSLSECFSKPRSAPMRNESVSAAYGSLFPGQSFNASNDTPDQSFSASGVFLPLEALNHCLDPLDSSHLVPPPLEDTYSPDQSFSASGVFLPLETLNHCLDPLDSSHHLPPPSFSASSKKFNLDFLPPPSYPRPPPSGPPPEFSDILPPPSLPSQSIAHPDIFLFSKSSRDISPPTLQIPSAPELFAVTCQ